MRRRVAEEKVVLLTRGGGGNTDHKGVIPLANTYNIDLLSGERRVVNLINCCSKLSKQGEISNSIAEATLILIGITETWAHGEFNDAEISVHQNS